jgi:hypothetical protein
MTLQTLGLAADIFVRVLLPGLALMALGAWLGRTKKLGIDTLITLNLFAFVPAFLLVRVAESRFAWAEVGRLGAAVLLPMFIVCGLSLLVFRAAGSSLRGRSTWIAAGMFSNAGNFGIPVAQLAFGDAGGAVQALVLLFMNTAVFFLGYLLMASEEGGLGGAVRGYLRLPMIYVIAAGLLVRTQGWVDPVPAPWLAWLWKAASLTAEGMVPVALITLGAQMASRPTWTVWRSTGSATAVKLLVMPAVTAAVVTWLGLWPWPGAQIILAAAAPTAVNTLLLSAEVKADVHVAAGAVFWTTALCSLTVTSLLVLLRALAPGALPVP